MSVSTVQGWVAPCRTASGATRLRLLCFPYAGGGASLFRTWSENLPATVEVCAVQLPGREARLKETPVARLGPLLDGLLQGLAPYWDRPCAFFGHSLGALVAFELARRLRERRVPGPVHLFVSGCGAPQLPDPELPIHDLPEAQFVEHLRRFNGTPSEVFEQPELLELFLPVLRADFALRGAYVYRPEPPLACPITAIGGARDPLVAPKRLDAWRAQTGAVFRLWMLPGDHFFVQSARERLLEVLASELKRHGGPPTEP